MPLVPDSITPNPVIPTPVDPGGPTVNLPPVAGNDILSSVVEDSGVRTIAAATLLANDIDLDQDPLTITAVGNAFGGTVARSGTTISFTPTANFAGTASFQYTVSDGDGGTDTAIVSFQVTAVNDAPSAGDDSLSAVAEDSGQRSIAFGTLTKNDLDIDFDNLTITKVTGAVGGSVSISGSNVLFTPTANYNGQAGFTYTVSDGNGGFDVATATFNVTPVNDQPDAVDDTLSAIAGSSGQQALAFARLTNNDIDPDGDTLTIIGVGSAVGGTVSISGSNVLFTPTANYSGDAGFVYTLSDGNGGTDTARASFEITAVNEPPAAADDTVAAVAEDSGQRSIAFGTLLGNDEDPNGDTLSVSAVGSVVGGTVSIDGGNVLFTPTANYNGQASFIYTASDGRGGTDTATASFTITPVNDAPLVANRGESSVAEDSGQRNFAFSTLLDGAIDVDGDSLTISSVGDAVGGTVSISGSNVLFTPTANFNGAARFSYTASDGHGGSDIGSVTFNITPDNDAPEAVDDTLAAIGEDSGQRQIAFSVLTGNDSDVDGDVLTVTSVGSAVGGTVSISGSNVLFTPTTDFSGEAGFTYSVADGKGGMDSAAASFEVEAVNDPPIAVNDTLSGIDEDSGPRQIAFADLTGNDDDPDDDGLTVTAVDDAVGGTVSISAGKVIFTPTANYGGAAGFTYTVSDGEGGTDTATVEFDIAPVNDAPVFGALPTISVNEDSGPVSGKLTATDADGDAVTFSGGFSSSYGTLSVASNGSWTFTVGQNAQSLSAAEGIGTIGQVTVTDGQGGSTSASISAAIIGANDAPVAGDDSFEVGKNGVLDGENVITNTAGVDIDVDWRDQLSVSAVNGAAGKVGTAVAGSTGGLFTITSSGALTFDPDGDYASLTIGQTATSTVSYKVADAFGGSDTATVTVTITGSNDEPVGADDSLSSVAEDSGERSIAFGTLLGNDDDPDGDALTISAVANAVGGSVSIDGGNVLFTPTRNFNGQASFTYTLSDGHGGTDTATASFEVTPVNDAPLASNLHDTDVDEDSGERRYAISSLLNGAIDADGDTLVLQSVGNAIGGSVTISGSDVVFAPIANYNGRAKFEFTISDGHGGTDTASVEFQVRAVNDVPIAQDDVFTIGEDGTLTGCNVITNPGSSDADVDGDTLTVLGVGASSGNVGTAVAGSNGGLFTIAASGELTFAPAGDFETLFAGQTATTRIAYTVSDGHGGTDTATVAVTVIGANEADIFTAGDDTRDLGAINLAAYTGAQVTKALAGKDVVQLSQTQNLGTLFEAGAGNDTVTGSSSGDRISGDGGKDGLLGGNGNDTLSGGAGDDSVSGGIGNDLLYGGIGSDTLAGGAGNDSFVFEEAGTETIADFGFGVGATGKDVIDLRTLDLADWTGSDSQITVAGSGSSRMVYVDLDNDHDATNNTTQSEIVIYVNALAGVIRNFVISDTNPLADIFV